MALAGPGLGPFSSWRAALTLGIRRAFVAAVAGTVTYLGACALALVVCKAIFPPVTGVQLQRAVESTVSGSEHVRQYQPVPLSRIDDALPLAVVAGEDSRFFQHWAIDWTEVGNALDAYQRGGALRGASSITQQLVKNLFLTTHSTYLRKVMEVPLAYGAELLLSKGRILELYVNVIEWGPGIYGAEAAAQYHYGQSAHSLTRYRAAALAACIPAPLTRRPQTVGSYKHVILQRMRQLGRLPISEPPNGGPPARTVSHASPFARFRPFEPLRPLGTVD